MAQALVTNDDGIDSPGLSALANAALDAGWDVTVAAPLVESSGTSAGLTAAADGRRVAVESRDLKLVRPAVAHGVAGHPGLIAFTACRGGFGDVPELLLSGINRGANVGRAILHSGTVGAALTASINGVRALAVSLDVGLDGAEECHWDTAAAVVPEALDVLDQLPEGAVLNLNVPNLPKKKVKALQWAALADFGVVQSRVERLRDGEIVVASVAVDTELEPGTDAALLAKGHATLTALRSVSEVARADLPNLS
ncbi:5'/3'-nucleotidase SurE [Actinokineospora sp. HUAS TT18]|uniref:5'/3'-nucleotidase SurE n=1 Tax=Actinokineospora sp. HUAS TT18 TaxID=3447451 RepID=UPI003F51F90E